MTQCVSANGSGSQRVNLDALAASSRALKLGDCITDMKGEQPDEVIENTGRIGLAKHR
jgi:hypothetical protein